MDLYQDDASTTKKGVVELATDTEETLGLAVQASDARLNQHPINSSSWIVSGEFYPANTLSIITSPGSPNIDTVATGPFALEHGYPGMTGNGTAAIDATYGVYQSFVTNGASGDALIEGFLQDHIKRKYNPKLFLRFKIPTTTTVRVFLGFVTSAASVTPLIANDDYLNARSGFGLYVTSGGNFRIASNDGSGATVFTSNLLTIDAAWHTIYLEADEANSQWGYSFDNAAITYVTTDIPASTTSLTMTHVNIQANVAAVRELRLLNGAYRHKWIP